MRWSASISVFCWVSLVVPAATLAQTTPPATPPSGAQTPAAPAPAAVEDTRSLFDTTWRQFSLGGRFTSVDGDPARFQRFQDMRDGLLFSDFRYAHEPWRPGHPKLTAWYERVSKLPPLASTAPPPA